MLNDEMVFRYPDLKNERSGGESTDCHCPLPTIYKTVIWTDYRRIKNVYVIFVGCECLGEQPTKAIRGGQALDYLCGNVIIDRVGELAIECVNHIMSENIEEQFIYVPPTLPSPMSVLEPVIAESGHNTLLFVVSDCAATEKTFIESLGVRQPDDLSPLTSIPTKPTLMEICLLGLRSRKGK
jgi:hypothetical protein